MAKINGKLKEQYYDGTTTKRITIKGDPFEQLSWVVRQTYNEKGPTNEVILYRLNEQIGIIPNVNFGTVVDLVYNKRTDTFQARKVELPSNDGDLVLWLFALPKKYRAKTGHEYREKRDQHIEALCKGEPLFWKQEYSIAGGKLAFAKKTVSSDPVCLSGQIIPEFAEEAIREILANVELKGLLAYEDIAIRDILRVRFGLTQDDFNSLRI